jgi:hypothetical protein
MSSKTEILNKLYVKQWVIGLVKADISEVIRTKTFRQNINWLEPGSPDHFYGDPFLLNVSKGELTILYEDFSFDDNYGNISMMILDKDMKEKGKKVLLDTGSHLSYPFIFTENERIYVLPESSRAGELSCYEYDPWRQDLTNKSQLIALPLLDTTILKYEGKYWLFGTIHERPTGYRLNIYYSDNLTGPYKSHPGNPVKTGYDGIRSAGNFIMVDGNIYRPSQNCGNAYGESMTIQKISTIDERNFIEEPYMDISIDERNREVHGIHTIHTINSMDGLIAVDGMKWTFSPKEQIKNFLRNRRHLQNQKTQTVTT